MLEAKKKSSPPFGEGRLVTGICTLRSPRLGQPLLGFLLRRGEKEVLSVVGLIDKVPQGLAGIAGIVAANGAPLRPGLIPCGRRQVQRGLRGRGLRRTAGDGRDIRSHLHIRCS